MDILMIRLGWNWLKCRVADFIASCVSDLTAKDLIVIIYLLRKDYIKY
jgi:hypothetical protein